jgi:MFS family permease
VLVFAQFAGTSLWFAGNAILPDLLHEPSLRGLAVGPVVSAVQLGFIAGTLLVALLGLADRVAPARLFLGCALAGSLANAALLLPVLTPTLLLALRVLTGLCLAGIYPVGLKLAADHYQAGLGRALGYLVGALVLGTALPHLLRWLAADLAWPAVILTISALALSGGLLLWLLVPDGPFRRPAARLNLAGGWQLWRERPFRQAALGYFGHMWELYTFWAFVPLLLATYTRLHPGTAAFGPGWTFSVLAAGAPACVAGGYLAQRWGSWRTARTALALSGVCCLLSPWLLALPRPVFGPLVVLWGMAAVADSPQFSTLVAQRVPATRAGTALTLVTCLGFALTVLSLQCFTLGQAYLGERYLFLVLAPGPLLGLLATQRGLKG